MSLDFDQWLCCLNRPGHDRGQFHRLFAKLDLSPHHTRDIKQIIDQSHEMVDLAFHHLSRFLSGGLILFFLLNWTAEWIWGYFVRYPNEFVIDGLAAVLALGIGIAVYKNERVHALANDVASELKKVTWPTRKETQMATIVVIVTVAIAAVIFFLFDLLWAYLTNLIYG